MKQLKVTIKDKFGNLNILSYQLYDTQLTDKWITLTNANLKRKTPSIHSVFNNRTEKDLPEIFKKLSSIVNHINKEYDKKLPLYIEYDNKKLNYLHEEFEIFGERIEELRFNNKLTNELSDNFYSLNEYIHICEDALITKENSWGAFGILYDIHPLGLHLPIQEEDKLMLNINYHWGKLYLGYNTLGKDWLNVFKDNDIEVIERDMVKPQRRFAAETWLNFNGDESLQVKISGFQKWVKDLKSPIKTKVLGHNISQLSLGRYLIGEVIIDDTFLNIDSDVDHWKVPRHSCKLKWNHKVLTTFRSIEKIEIVDV